MGKSGGKQTSTSEPWKGAVPYLMGGMNSSGSQVPGIFNEAANLYQRGGWTPQMQSVNDLYQSLFGGRLNGSNQMIQSAGQIAGGDYNTGVNTPANINAMMVDPTGMRAAQGVLDPTQAYLQLLSGQVNNQYLDPLMQNVMTNITRNTQEKVLPGLRSESMGAGQYGSSRQGVAEGLATSRMNQDLATGIAPIYAQAFENAQNRMQGAASELNLQGERIATGNADRRLNADQFNSNLTLQGNTQRLAANQANMGNQLRASDLYGQALNFQDLGFGQYMQLLGMPAAYDRNNLAGYAGIIQPGAGLGGTQTQTAQQGRNPITSAAGGAMMGATFGPMGAGIGGILGLLSGLF